MLNLDAIKARIAAATPGPWTWGEVSEYLVARAERWNGNEFEEAVFQVAPETEWEDVVDDGWDYAHVSNHGDGPALTAGGQVVIAAPSEHCCPHMTDLAGSDADKALVANAPTDLAALVAEVERLRARVAELEAAASA